MLAKAIRACRRMGEFFGDASWPTRLNTARSIAGALSKTPDPVPPLRLQIEVTTRCNINCIMCSRSMYARSKQNNELKLGDMSPALYDKVSDLTKHAQETVLFGYGEPLVSRAFYDLLPRIHSSRFGFFTNGMAMTPKLLDRIRSMTKSTLSSVVFSIDGGTKETFERIRAQASFERVFGNLKALADYRREKGLDFELRVSCVAMLDNIRELPQLFDHADNAGADLLHVKHLVADSETFRNQCLFYHKEECRNAFARAKAHAAGRRMRLDLPYDFSGRETADNPPNCRVPWIYTMVSFDGDVRACCFATEDLMTMGSLNESTFEEIWHNKKYHALRKSFHGGKGFPRCMECENRFRSVPSPSDEATYVKIEPGRK